MELDDKAPQSDNEDDEDKEIKRKAMEIYKKGLIFYRRTDPMLRSRRNANQPDPTQIVLPSGKTLLGFPPTANMGTHGSIDPNDDNEHNDDNVIVFSARGQDQVLRGKTMVPILYILLMSNTILSVGLFASSDSSVESNRSRGLTFACSLLTYILGSAGLYLQDTRIITLFMAVTFVDAAINLLRVYSIMQFSQFCLSMAICHIMAQYKDTLLASWFQPMT